jgi:outer membrane protein, heavy metal efflux system
MKKIATIIFTLIGIVQAKAQDTLSLHDILMHITMHSQHLQMFDAQIKSEEAAVKGAYSWEAPELGTGFWMTPYNPKYFKGENGMGGMGQYMISAQQMFPVRKRQNAEAAYLGAMSSVTKEKREAMQNDLFAEAKKNFYQWMVLKKKMAVLSESEKLIDLIIKTAEIRYKNNTGDITAYYKAKAALGNIHTMRVQLQNEMVQKRIALNTLMHRDRMYEFDIDTAYTVKDFSNIVIDSSELINSRSDIQELEKEVQVSKLQQNVERQSLKPGFGLRYDHMIGLGNMPMQYTLMVMVKIPFASWSSKRSKANIESLRWKVEAQSKQREALINEVLGEAYSVRTEITERKKQIKLYEEEIIPALRRNYQTTQLAYEQNTEKLFVLYDAWDQFNKIQLEYIDQLQQLLVLQAELERILEIKE